MVKIAPSILSADFANLERDIKLVEEKGADYIHVDVMDGQFVPNITLGANIVSAIRPVTKLPLDVHLMIVEPERFIPDFAKAGSDIITVHAESTVHIHRAMQMIKNEGVKAGVVINPGTPVSVIEHVLPLADLVLIMTVNPGFGGQAFISECLEKVEQLDELRKEKGYTYEIEIDGGVDNKTAKACVDAGADVLVAGSYVYNSPDVGERIATLREVTK
ncbi:ribulose-phosphate 3-epimerase [Vagococcus carniphilus]|uniref:Ribulose-phosphate 3-epimerase n=1 Tax=Vagococcus carniphilus TaxID=218144 RepID=A0A430B3D4_9ENTE|nr:ribulose-phosphate 3-epimerase [Vagococcus carniphilus]MDT2813371.1 ribulose-phosphate 3-epimerase [Vagococcus carniphilus]MDT2830175.1 ribulose-phosphate 3-epimerase [Vagococcus carniphilus]MDT2833860.1 ribulose-phosphate 3-epimerase [Vagococcus carniphilus]MDT2838607.1 ribulose-phosphate 3-epimerase [Vagococcus carniphilus]MDT2848208.1 ribulose-phosphate 3-epimerase [Vagococcus carniphilus]